MGSVTVVTMSVYASLGASGLSIALGLANSRSIAGLSRDVEDMRAAIAPENLEGSATTTISGGDTSPASIEKRLASLETLETSVSLGLDATKIDLSGLRAAEERLSAGSKRLGIEVKDLLLDIENLTEVSPEIRDLLEEWGAMKSAAYMGGTNDEVLQISRCRVGFQKNRGPESAIHFNDVGDPNHSMYVSASAGYSPAMSTGDALRIRVGEGDKDGFIVETTGAGPSLRGVFSVSSRDGSTTMGSASIKTTRFSHLEHADGARSYAVSQNANGLTGLNSSLGQEVQLCIGGQPRVRAGPTNVLSIKNGNSVADTQFGKDGETILVSRNGAHTRFRTGSSGVDSLAVSSAGVRINGDLTVQGVDIKQEIMRLFSRVDAIEGTLEERWDEKIKDLADPEITDGYKPDVNGEPYAPSFVSPPGSYNMVKITNNPDREALSLGEVEVFDENFSNIARDPSKVYDVWQTDTTSGGEASRAVNGVVHGNFNNNGVTHTNFGSSKVWRVSFKVPVSIKAIRVYPRTDLHYGRLHDCQIQLWANDEVVETRQLVGNYHAQSFFFLHGVSEPEQVFLPIPPPPPSLESLDRVSFRSVSHGVYWSVGGNNRVDDTQDYAVKVTTSNNTSSSRWFDIQTLDGTEAIKNLTDVTLKNPYRSSYLEWTSHHRINATAQDRTTNECKFRIESENTYIADGDVVTLWSYGGSGYVNALKHKNLDTLGGGKEDPNSQYFIELA